MTRTDPRWADFADQLHVLAAWFGEPGELAEEGAVRRSFGLALLGWLRALETIARALLVTLARELRLDGRAAAPTKRRAKDPSKDEAAPDEIEQGYDSERWLGVRFVLLPRDRKRGARGDRRDWRRETIETRPLAFRFEALIRVAEAPERYARRMARLLRREPAAVVTLLRDVRRPPPLRGEGIGGGVFPRRRDDIQERRNVPPHASAFNAIRRTPPPTPPP